MPMERERSAPLLHGHLPSLVHKHYGEIEKENTKIMNEKRKNVETAFLKCSWAIRVGVCWLEKTRNEQTQTHAA
ncbi:MAG: hypothetical protein CSA33_06975 [Desulfobulbus propionicus]|nr:MAG: hypothetical protein CSA33_06975 [Desulfobulbus propionicus]